MSPQTRLPPTARILRLAFFSTYWAIVLAFLASLGYAVIGGQVEFWSPPPGTVHEDDDGRCEAAVRELATALDAGLAAALRAAERDPRDALPSYRRFGQGWDLRWRRTRYGCALDGSAPWRAALASAAGRLLDHRYALESLVRRYSEGPGSARARIGAQLRSGGG